MKKAYKLLRRTPAGGLTDTFTGRKRYAIGAITRDHKKHGLSVFPSPMGAVDHPVPSSSAAVHLPAVLVEVAVPERTRLIPGRKQLVRSLRVTRIVGEYDPRIVCRGSGYRRADAQRWIARGYSDFRVVNRLPRGLPSAWEISLADRGAYRVVCRPAKSGRWGKSVEYRAERMNSEVSHGDPR